MCVYSESVLTHRICRNLLRSLIFFFKLGIVTCPEKKYFEKDSEPNFKLTHYFIEMALKNVKQILHFCLKKI